MSPRQTRAVSEILAVVDTLARSPALLTYRVGITMDAARRRKQYKYASKPVPWPHMVFLAFDLDATEAIAMEQAVFDALMAASKRSAAYQRYDEVCRDKPYRNSLGGKRDPDDAYCLYVAWRNKESA